MIFTDIQIKNSLIKEIGPLFQSGYEKNTGIKYLLFSIQISYQNLNFENSSLGMPFQSPIGNAKQLRKLEQFIWNERLDVAERSREICMEVLGMTKSQRKKLLLEQIEQKYSIVQKGYICVPELLSTLRIELRGYERCSNPTIYFRDLSDLYDELDELKQMQKRTKKLLLNLKRGFNNPHKYRNPYIPQTLHQKLYNVLILGFSLYGVFVMLFTMYIGYYFLCTCGKAIEISQECMEITFLSKFIWDTLIPLIFWVYFAIIMMHDSIFQIKKKKNKFFDLFK